MDPYDRLFVATAFVLQILLLTYFALRRLNFGLALRWGWLIYALAIPACLVSLLLLTVGKPWQFWLAGFLYAVFTIFGYTVDLARPITWRSPIYLPVFTPYVLLFLGSQMFYWFSLALIQRPLWFVYAVLFAASSVLNITSHTGR
jgi:hypothetical protein